MSTDDLDIMPDPEPQNLERLAAVLSRPDTARKIGASTFEPHPVINAMEFRTETICSYVTSDGPIDVLMQLPDVGTYDDVVRNARRYLLGDISIFAADIDDIIRSKVATDRAKDWRALDVLYETRDRLRREPDPYEVDPAALMPDDPDT
ncbi:MAG: hypothetical protein SGJ13_10055 [Actinomycetota bacterium]|nr:hypothetical protein [Actinomycetota bacterium]